MAPTAARSTVTWTSARPSRLRKNGRRVRHHLVDIIDPSDDYSVGLYVRQARKAIADVLECGGVPIVVGGTGQYVWALLEGWNVPEVSPDSFAQSSNSKSDMSRIGLA